MNKNEYLVEFTQKAKKDFEKLDKSVAKIIKKWLSDNLINTKEPRKNGKPLKGNLRGLWRYRIGDFRIIAEIQDEKLLIILIEIAHRKDIYK